VDIAGRLGARGYAARARDALAGLEPERPAGFVRRGDVWTLTFDGVSAQVPDVKGLHDLARLLATPGREIGARELAGDPTPDTGADPVLDERAKAAYRARLEQLDADRDEAAAHHDEGRLARATAERE